jgi:hypothetical protein
MAANATCAGLNNMKMGDDIIIATILNAIITLQIGDLDRIFKLVGRQTIVAIGIVITKF